MAPVQKINRMFVSRVQDALVVYEVDCKHTDEYEATTLLVDKLGYADVTRNRLMDALELLKSHDIL